MGEKKKTGQRGTAKERVEKDGGGGVCVCGEGCSVQDKEETE